MTPTTATLYQAEIGNAIRAWKEGRRDDAFPVLVDATCKGAPGAAGLLMQLAGRNAGTGPGAREGHAGDAPPSPLTDRHLAFAMASGCCSAPAPAQAMEQRLATARNGDLQAQVEIAVLAAMVGQTQQSVQALECAAKS